MDVSKMSYNDASKLPPPGVAEYLAYRFDETVERSITLIGFAIDDVLEAAGGRLEQKYLIGLDLFFDAKELVIGTREVTILDDSTRWDFDGYVMSYTYTPGHLNLSLYKNYTLKEDIANTLDDVIGDLLGRDRD